MVSMAVSGSVCAPRRERETADQKQESVESGSDPIAGPAVSESVCPHSGI